MPSLTISTGNAFAKRNTISGSRAFRESIFVRVNSFWLLRKYFIHFVTLEGQTRNKMSVIEIRPRFKQSVPIARQDIIRRFERDLAQTSDLEGSIMDHHIVLRIPIERQHYWSPRLSLTLEEETAGGSTLIRGLFGPRPSVWLLFVFLYSSIGVISLFVAITGFSQLSLGMSAPALWALPVAAVIALGLYLAAKAGERLGREEMYVLKNFMDATLVNSANLTENARKEPYEDA